MQCAIETLTSKLRFTSVPDFWLNVRRAPGIHRGVRDVEVMCNDFQSYDLPRYEASFVNSASFSPHLKHKVGICCYHSICFLSLTR